MIIECIKHYHNVVEVEHCTLSVVSEVIGTQISCRLTHQYQGYQLLTNTPVVRFSLDICDFLLVIL